MPKTRLLVVDDDPQIQRMLRPVLAAPGHEVRVVGSGGEALVAVAEEEPDLVLLDITMPGMSGLEAASAIVAAGSRVLIFTMHESGHLAAEVFQAGAQGFVLKSQAGKDLIRAIERLLVGGTFFGSEPNPHGSLFSPSQNVDRRFSAPW